MREAAPYILSMPSRRAILLSLPAVLLARPAEGAEADVLALLRQPGHVALMRHAQTTPGVGDPPGFKLGECATQRNLSEEGRRDAARLGEAFRENGVAVARVLSSEWCRCLETARLMALAPVETAPLALNSFFDARGERERSTAALRELLAGFPRDAAAIVLVTHQVNVTALTGVFPASGEIVALRLAPEGGFTVAGRRR